MVNPKISTNNLNNTSTKSSVANTPAQTPPMQFKPIFNMSKKEKANEFINLLGSYNKSSDYNIVNMDSNILKNKDKLKYELGSNGKTTFYNDEVGIHFDIDDKKLNSAVSGLRNDSDKTNDKQDGIVGSFEQGEVRDCAFLYTLDNLGESPEGKNIIKETVKNNSNGTFSVKLKGASSAVIVSEKELKKGTININSEEPKLSTGDKDVRIFEIAAAKYIKAHPNEFKDQASIDGMEPKTAWALLTGKKDTKTLFLSNKNDKYYKDVLAASTTNDSYIKDNNLTIKKLNDDLNKIKQFPANAKNNAYAQELIKDIKELEKNTQSLIACNKSMDIEDAKSMGTPEGKKATIWKLLSTTDPSRLGCNTHEIANSVVIGDEPTEKGINLSNGRVLYEKHGYNIIGVDSKNKTIKLSNPHNTQEPFNISYDEFVANKLSLTIFEGLK